MHWNITSAADEKYICHIATLLHSITDNKSGDDNITFHLLSNGVSECNIQKLHTQVGDKCNIVVYNISNLRHLLPAGIPATIAITAYARLFLADIISHDIKTLLYLDCDTIVNKSLTPLFKINMGDFLAAGVLDTLPDNKSKTSVELNRIDPYYNSGVLLINLELWRKENIKKKFIKYLVSKKGIVHHHDQGIINHVLKGRIFTLPVEYNLTSNYFSHPYNYLSKRNTPFYPEKEIIEAKNRPAIIHYTEGFLLRPWVMGSQHPLKKIYLKHKSYTEWKDTPLSPDKRPAHVKILAFCFLHLHPVVYHIISYLLFVLASFFKIKRNY